jgi:hypothetical protein
MSASCQARRKLADQKVRVMARLLEFGGKLDAPTNDCFVLRARPQSCRKTAQIHRALALSTVLQGNSLAVIVVGGSGKDIGKTALMCAVIAALREFQWTAVKITGHDYEPDGAAVKSAVADATIWEESTSGEETDTGRYLAAGARRALLVTRSGRDVPLVEIQNALGADRNVIFESNRIVDVLRPDVCLALIGGASEMKPSFERLLTSADAVVTVGCPVGAVPAGMRRFQLESVEQLPAEMVEWLRERLGGA